MAYGLNRNRKRGLFGNPVEQYAAPGLGSDITQAPQHTPEMRQSAQPEQGQKRSGGLFGKGGVGRAIAGTVGDYLMQQGGMAPVYAPAMMAQRQREAETQQAELKRAQEMADWRWKEDYKRDNAAPEGPKTYEDNAGNRWAYDPSTGQTIGDSPIWVDPTPKEFVHEGMRFSIPNPYARGGSSGGDMPTVSDKAGYDAIPPGEQYRDPQGNIRTKAGGPTQPASGGF